MKKYFALLMFALSHSAWAEDPIRLSEPVEQTVHSETFGSALDTRLQLVSIEELKSQPQNYLHKSFQLTTRVAKVCQKKGCFFIAQQDDDIIRVSFRNYDFFIPTDSGGKQVTLAGTLVKKTMSEEQAAHFRRDLNANNATLEPGEVYEIVADSVRIPKSS